MNIFVKILDIFDLKIFGRSISKCSNFFPNKPFWSRFFQSCVYFHGGHEPHFQAGETHQTSCQNIQNFPRMPQKVLEMCPRVAQTSLIDRVWNVGTIYDGIMLWWTDRIAIGAENDRSTSGEPAERM